MNRDEFLLRGITKQSAVLEIGPYHSPIAKKQMGYNVCTIDIMDQQALRELAAADPNLTSASVDAIERVDIIGSATDVADAVRAKLGPRHEFDWILSSHNIEHIPNPIRFFQQSASILRVGGVLRLAVPDKRACFDYFRPLTEIAGWLEAFHEQRSRPSIYQVFQQESVRCWLRDGRKKHSSWPIGSARTDALSFRDTLLGLYDEWFGPEGKVPTHYIDTHCWTFTPESFALLIHDLRGFGLVPFRILNRTETRSHEFFVDLEKMDESNRVDRQEFYTVRSELVRRVEDDLRGKDAERAASTAMGTRLTILGKVLREIRRLGRRLLTGL